MLTQSQKEAIRQEAESYVPVGDPMIEYPCFYHETEIENAYIAAAEKYQQLLNDAVPIKQESQQERMFSLAEMVSCFEAGVKRGESYISGWGYENNNGDEYDYFKQKFNIDL